MPLFDVRCFSCGTEQIDVFLHAGQALPACACGAVTEKVWRAAAVIGDAMDFWSENMGPDPVHITSRTQWHREMASRGLVNKVRHVPTRGSDKSPHTSRWV